MPFWSNEKRKDSNNRIVVFFLCRMKCDSNRVNATLRKSQSERDCFIAQYIFSWMKFHKSNVFPMLFVDLRSCKVGQCEFISRSFVRFHWWTLFFRLCFWLTISSLSMSQSCVCVCVCVYDRQAVRLFELWCLYLFRRLVIVVRLLVLVHCLHVVGRHKWAVRLANVRSIGRLSGFTHFVGSAPDRSEKEEKKMELVRSILKLPVFCHTNVNSVSHAKTTTCIHKWAPSFFLFLFSSF